MGVLGVFFDLGCFYAEAFERDAGSDAPSGEVETLPKCLLEILGGDDFVDRFFFAVQRLAEDVRRPLAGIDSDFGGRRGIGLELFEKWDGLGDFPE